MTVTYSDKWTDHCPFLSNIPKCWQLLSEH